MSIIWYYPLSKAWHKGLATYLSTRLLFFRKSNVNNWKEILSIWFFCRHKSNKTEQIKGAYLILASTASRRLSPEIILLVVKWKWHPAELSQPTGKFNTKALFIHFVKFEISAFCVLIHNKFQACSLNNFGLNFYASVEKNPKEHKFYRHWLLKSWCKCF